MCAYVGIDPRVGPVRCGVYRVKADTGVRPYVSHKLI